MAPLMAIISLAFLLISSLCPPTNASDPDPLQDFCVTDMVNRSTIFLNGLPCKNRMHVKSADFKSDQLKKMGNTTNPFGVAVTLASAANVGGLNTQGLSLARIDYAKGGLVPPHIHPRASEVLFVVDGTLSVGFVDTNNVLFAETLRSGDLFVFPRGLVHFIFNIGEEKALTLSGLNSQNPGASLVANALFGAEPPMLDKVLERAFQLSVEQVKHLKKVFG